MNKSGHTVLITGGSRGIGLAMAIRFQALGNTVVVVGQNRARLETVQVEYPRLITFCADLTKTGEINAVVNFVKDKYPGVNVLINNAAIQNEGDFDKDVNEEELMQEIAINIRAPVLLTKLLLPILKTHPEAAIINISSALAIAPKAQAPLYCASKAFLHSFSKGLRYQLNDTGVKVIELQPPLVDTDMTKGRHSKDKLTPEQVVDDLLIGLERNQPLIRVGKAKLLAVLHRLAPRFVENVIKDFQ